MARLRAGEVVRLKVGDIDSDQEIIRIVQSKGGDRRVATCSHSSVGWQRGLKWVAAVRGSVGAVLVVVASRAIFRLAFSYRSWFGGMAARVVIYW